MAFDCASILNALYSVINVRGNGRRAQVCRDSLAVSGDASWPGGSSIADFGERGGVSGHALGFDSVHSICSASEDIFTRAPKICPYVRNRTDSHSSQHILF
jgi:hypothetical protein